MIKENDTKGITKKNICILQIFSRIQHHVTQYINLASEYTYFYVEECKRRTQLTYLSSEEIYTILKTYSFLVSIHQNQFMVNPIMVNLIKSITDHDLGVDDACLRWKTKNPIFRR